jgi:hypothetical protein
LLFLIIYIGQPKVFFSLAPSQKSLPITGLEHTDSGQHAGSRRFRFSLQRSVERVPTSYLLSITYEDSSESSVEGGLLLLLLAVRKKSKKRKWSHEIYDSREYVGEYHRLCTELHSHEDTFFTYFRMSRDCFEELHQLPGVVQSVHIVGIF